MCVVYGTFYPEGDGIKPNETKRNETKRNEAALSSLSREEMDDDDEVTGWTPAMTKELRRNFDENTRREGFASRAEILTIAARCGEDPEDLEDQIDLLEFNGENLLPWDDFFDWWSEEVDPRDYME